MARAPAPSDGAERPTNSKVRKLIRRKTGKRVRTLGLQSDCYWHCFFRIVLISLDLDAMEADD